MILDPIYNVRPTDDMFLDCVLTPLNEGQATYYLRQAWIKLFGTAPSLNSLGILWSQSALETGRWKLLRCNNWGNIKKRDGIKYTSYECSEILNGKNVFFNPYHPQTFFAAWESALEGAVGYLDFVSKKPRYQKAWIKLQEGDVSGYVLELHNAGYFTADVNVYLKTTTKLFNEFLCKSDQLLNWKPPISLQSPPEPAQTQPEEVVLPQTPNVIIESSKDDIKNQSQNFVQIIILFLSMLFKKLLGV